MIWRRRKRSTRSLLATVTAERNDALAEIERLSRSLGWLPWPVSSDPADTLARIEALHQPHPWHTLGEVRMCAGCSDLWPCATARLIDGDDVPEVVTLEHSPETLTNVHNPMDCEGRPCTVHSRSDHGMRAFPQHWRMDRALMERICPHGVGHPDPDGPYPPGASEWVHGCDGCCMGI